MGNQLSINSKMNSINHYENLIGNCDNKVIPPSFKDFKKEELLKLKKILMKALVEAILKLG